MSNLHEIFDMAREGTLPPMFDKWELWENDGLTVAHVVAQRRHLPTDFDQWDLKDNAGWSVRDIYDLQEE
ncbi:hypothetical protein [Thiolapillus sp.]|uniref:hypothetical protein n=1 Tax=Thiolapillus sp. TaxID=2017437 RepID=UPI003AF4170B